MSLITSLLGIAMASLLAATLARTLNVSFRAQKSIDYRDQIVTIREIVRSGADCKETMAAAGSCATGKPVTVLSSNGRIVVDGINGTTFGAYRARAWCDATGITVQAALLRKGVDIWNHQKKDFIPEPLRQSVQNFNAPESQVLAGNTKLCRHGATGSGFVQARGDIVDPYTVNVEDTIASVSLVSSSGDNISVTGTGVFKLEDNDIVILRLREGSASGPVRAKATIEGDNNPGGTWQAAVHHLFTSGGGTDTFFITFEFKNGDGDAPNREYYISMHKF